MPRIIVLLMVFSLFIIIGCSSGNTPVTTLNPDPSDITFMPDKFPVFVSDVNNDGSPHEGMGFLGVFELHLSPDSAELVPLRKSSLTDTLEVVDITNFLTLAPCTDCAKISSLSLDSDGNVTVKIGIRHPFGESATR